MLKQLKRFWPFGMVMAIVLFPFQWLGQKSGTFNQLIMAVFPTEDQHAIGHLGIFFLFGGLLLRTFPSLRSRPWLYMGLILLAGLAEETGQVITKHYLDVIDTAHDLVLDLIAGLIVLALVTIWQKAQYRRKLV